jgi:DNA invertase Pin-like site-specific DNA recombinase
MGPWRGTHQSRNSQQNYATENLGLFRFRNPLHIGSMIYRHARVSKDRQSVATQVAVLTAAGAGKVFRETTSGAKTGLAQQRQALDQLDAGDGLLVTRLDRLARSTRDLPNTLAAIAGHKAGFRSLADTRVDTATVHGRLMLIVLGGLAGFDRNG